MSQETATALDKVEELEPDLLGNPAAKAFRDSVRDTRSGKPYELIEGQFPEADRPLDYENERIFLVRYGRRLAMVLRIMTRDGSDEEADAELQIEDGLQHPDDARVIAEFVMVKHSLERVVVRPDAVLVSPQASLDVVDSLMDGSLHQPDDETLVLSRAA